jgi:hypothetical protein
MSAGNGPPRAHRAYSILGYAVCFSAMMYGAGAFTIGRATRPPEAYDIIAPFGLVAAGVLRVPVETPRDVARLRYENSQLAASLARCRQMPRTRSRP